MEEGTAQDNAPIDTLLEKLDLETPLQLEPPLLQELGVEIQPYDAEKVLQPEEQQVFEEKLGLFLAGPEGEDFSGVEEAPAPVIIPEMPTFSTEGRRRRLSSADASTLARHVSKRITKDQVEALLSHFESLVDALDEGEGESRPVRAQSVIKSVSNTTATTTTELSAEESCRKANQFPKPPSKPPPAIPVTNALFVTPPAPPSRPAPPARPAKLAPQPIIEEEEMIEETLILPPAKTLPDIPTVLQKALDFIAENALKLPGIFRVPPAASDMEALMDVIKRDPNCEFPAGADPHAVASYLKQYFRNMPEPILTYDLYDCFMATEGIPDRVARVNCLTYLVGNIRPTFLTQAFALFSLLKKVSDYSEHNKMGAKNLATVFAPNLLRPREQTIEQMSIDVQKLPTVIEAIINEYEEVFQLYLPRTETVKRPAEEVSQPQAPTESAPPQTEPQADPVQLPSKGSGRLRGLNLAVDTTQYASVSVPIASPGRPLPTPPQAVTTPAPTSARAPPSTRSVNLPHPAIPSKTPMSQTGAADASCSRFQPLPAGSSPAGPPPPLPPRPRTTN